MRRWAGLITLACLLAALGYFLVATYVGGVRLGGTPARIEARWQTEEQWLVDSIARDLVEMVRFAAGGAAAPAADSDVTVTPAAGGLPLTVAASVAPGGDVGEPIALKTFVWAPGEYAGLVRSLLAAANVPPATTAAPPRDSTDLLQALTDPKPEVIERANQRVSAALTSGFTDPAHHDAAALVLSAFALREAAGMYSDGRATLCRIAAHLAFASALRQNAEPTAAGRYAHATLLVLAGRGADAAAALGALDGDANPAGRAWQRALRRRLFEDTRSDPDPQSWLERRELYRALIWTLDSDSALKHGERLSLGPGPERWRLASEHLTVEAGNVLLEDAVDRELAEARTVWQIVNGGAIADKELWGALNEPAQRCIGPGGPRVIGWGTWAAFFQRHLINALWSVDRHTRHMLGLDERADRQLRAMHTRFGGLVLYPMIETRCEMEARRRPKRYDDLITVMVERPELVNAFQWWSMAEASRYEAIRRGPPELIAWFSPAAPRGTTFDVVGRRNASLLPRDLAGIEALHSLSPQDFQVTSSLLDVKYAKGGPVQEIARILGPRAHYDMRALHRLGGEAARDIAAVGPFLERRCALVAGECFDYGAYLVETGQRDAAARAFQRGRDLAADRVGASNSVRWLMNHYLDKGDTDRAREVATEAASTGSGRGLKTLARFLERTGDHEGAETVLHQVRERYGNRAMTPEEKAESEDGEQDGDELAGLYYRMAHVRKQPGYDQRFRNSSGGAFAGLPERAETGALSGYPSDGVFILNAGAFAERNGLKTGDIIVALDGYRIRSRRQYSLINRFSDDPEMALVVFRHPRYLEVKVRTPWRNLGADMRTHKTSG